MKVYLTCREIAEMQLPGLPSTKRGVQFFAKRARWLGTPCGHVLKYHIDCLPPDARAAYVARHIAAVEVPSTIARDAAAEPAAVSLTGPATEARDARLALLSLADKLAADGNLSRRRADRHLCDLYNAGRLIVAGWIKDEVASLSVRTLKRWRAKQRRDGAAALAVDRAAARKHTGLLDRVNDGAVKTYALALIAKQPQLTAHHIRALVADRFPVLTIGERAVAVPPVRTFQRALKAWRTGYRNALLAVRNPDGFKSAVRFTARVTQPAQRLNEVWQIDASPADVLTTEGRYSIYVCEDIYSRRLIAHVSRTAAARAVALLIRKAIIAWGVPERIKTDNGSDFIARDTRRLFAALGIEHELSAPFRPEQKGHVERAIGTLQRGLMRTLPGYIGHSVADRRVIEHRKSFAARLGEAPEDMFEVALSPQELQRRVDDWCRHVYGAAPHAGLNGMTPFAVAAMAAGPVRRVEDVRALDMLLMPVAGKDGLRTVTKSGIRIEGAYYIGGFLDVGSTVLVRMDEADLGRAYVYSADGATYLGEAIAPELAGVDPKAAIAAVRAEQKRIIDERLAEVRPVARRIRALDIAPAIRQAQVDAGRLVEFPKPVETHDTPALAAARSAATEQQPVHSEETLRVQAELLAERSAPAADIVRLRAEETMHQRFRRAREIEAALARNEFVEPEQLLWLGAYREGPEYRGLSDTYGAPPSQAHEA